MTERLLCHLTVAAVVEDAGRFLFVEERPNGKSVLNQPAGHLDSGETLIEAVIREVREETTLEFKPTGWLGALSLELLDGRVSQRIAFVGHADGTVDRHALDPDIVAVHWLTLEAARALAPFRSPLVEASIAWSRSGPVLPLDRLAHFRSDGSIRLRPGQLW